MHTNYSDCANAGVVLSLQLRVSQSAGARRGPGDGAGLFARQIHNWSGRGRWSKRAGAIRSGTSRPMPRSDLDQLYWVGRFSIGHFQNQGKCRVAVVMGLNVAVSG